ncbi:MAG: tetratricopeptide repeat protein [Candidatus Omnitrophota bacterium]|nr:tetratricopeptide repeat protein [Candidatus Omnitrophota bacterium]
MNFFWAFIIFCLSCTGSFVFAQNQKSDKDLYTSYLKGFFSAEDGNFRAALEELEKVKKADPKSIYIRLKIASLLIRLGELDKAEKELKEAKTLDTESFDASLALVFLYSYAQKDSELEKEYEDFLKRAHKVKPDDIKISQYLAQFYFYKKQPQEALKIYEAILKKNPNDVEGVFWLGYIYDELGKREDAVKMWRKALEIDPSHGLSLNSLGYVYAQEGKNLEEAEKMILKALEKEPENGAYLDSLGWVYFKKKNYKKAEEYLKKAINCQDDPVIYEHLGDLYAELDDSKAALNYYTVGLSKFPDNKVLKNKLERYGKENKTSKN